MKFVIIGAGAIGAYIGALMTRAELDVTLFARGPHLRAMREHGLRVQSRAGNFEVRPKVTDALESIGLTDVVFLSVKAYSLPELAPRLRPLLGPETTVVSLQNGVPWWFFQNFPGEFQDLRIERIDPGGVMAAAVETRRIVGSIVYISSAIVEPGAIQHTEGNRVTIGELDGTRSARLCAIADALVRSGLRCPITTSLRAEIWVKLLGNVAFNPISALTGATLAQMARDSEIAVLVRQIMREAQTVANRLGFDLPISIEQRMAGAEKVGGHKTSMLQDLEAGRPLELEAVVGVVVELGERLGLPMTHTRAIYVCAKLLAQCRQRK
ncbi:MAG: 2-dehydropantoate 2-reductase [Acidobacteria bacterium]|nr:2-dehydropantoate 2-reductase [Acidobacteriota bacterium]MBI3655887.1 2-dehydropantoate 2-reductase [Acidobacteriota bacterium]